MFTVCCFSMDNFICGIAPSGDNVVLLTYDEENTQQVSVLFNSMISEQVKEKKGYCSSDTKPNSFF